MWRRVCILRILKVGVQFPPGNEEWEPKTHQPGGGEGRERSLKSPTATSSLHFCSPRHFFPSAPQNTLRPPRGHSSPRPRAEVLPLLTPASVTPPLPSLASSPPQTPFPLPTPTPPAASALVLYNLCWRLPKESGRRGHMVARCKEP